MTQHPDIGYADHARANDKVRLFRLISALVAVSLLMLGMMTLVFGCGGKSLTEPEATVQKFLSAGEEKDVDAILELMHPQALADMQEMITADGQTFDEVKPLLVDYFFPYDSVKFSDVEFETTEVSEDEAIVQIVEGTMTQTVDGVTETFDAEDSDPLYLYLIDGEWYIDFDATGDSLSGPEAAVQEFLIASEDKDVDAILELMHPQALAEMQEMITADGQTFDEVKPLLVDYFFPYDSVKFSDIEFETTELGQDEVIVQVVGGTMTQTVDGVTETFDAEDSDPLYLYLVDGEWYIDFDAL